MKPEILPGSVYDYPKYYDVLFNADCRTEYHFLLHCFSRLTERPVQRVFEPACGTGRLLYRLARSGYDVTGLDLNPKAVEYCNQRLKRNRFPESVIVGDMCDFRLNEPQDFAFNLINSFRHLRDEASAIAHLQCMADVLAPGGIYLLGLHLTPESEPVCDREYWTGQRGTLRIDSAMWVEKLDRENRQEHIAFDLDIHKPSANYRIEDRFIFRTYTPEQFQNLVDQVESLEIIETYNFLCDIDSPVCIDHMSEDIIYALRKH